MKKKMIMSSIGITLLAIAGSASATTIDFNEWGSVSQFRTLKGVAPAFLTSNITYGAYKTPACTSAGAVVCDSAGTSTCVITGTSCANYGGKDITFRINYNKSYDAVSSLISGDPYNGSPYAATYGGLTCAAGTRPMLVSSASGASWSCQAVHLASSDVAGSSFTGSTTGNKQGPVGSSTITRTFPATGISVSTLNEFTPLSTAWTFYVNNAVQVSKCVGGSYDGNLCTAATATTDCDTGSCTSGPLDNITREMAVQIFSGNAALWSDLGASYTVTGATQGVDDYVVPCDAHVGAGGQHVLDFALMNKGKWGGALPTAQKTAAIDGQYYWFNDTVTDRVKCINGNSVVAGYPAGDSSTGSGSVGAIGQLDCNQPVSVSNTSQNVHKIKYNGQPGHRNTIRNGNYDFFNNLYMYEQKSIAGTDQDKLIHALTPYLQEPAHVNAAAIGSADAACIAAKNEMTWNKDKDGNYPGYVGAVSKQTP